MTNSKVKIAAAVDIGSESVNMKIAQQDEKGGLEFLENLTQPVNLGEESIFGSSVSFDSAEKVSDILNNYYNLIKEYQVPREYVLSFATTAIRNAKNKDYVIDQINVKTQREIEIFEDAEEKSIIFREMLRRYKNQKDAEKNFLMVYTGTGSVGVAAVVNEMIVYSQNVNTDTLKLTKMTEDIESLTMSDFTKVIDEYLNYITGTVKRNLKNTTLETIVASGEEISFIQSLCKTHFSDDENIIKKKNLIALYEDVTNKSSKYLVKTFGLPFEKSKKLLIIIASYIKLLDIMKAKLIVNVEADLSDAVLYELLNRKKAKAEKKEFDLNIVSSARFMARRYACDEKHSGAVENFALTIFDNLKKVHGFSRRERLYLQTAAILHDIGKYVDSTVYDLATVHLIKNSFIISLTSQQKDIIANIARYHGNEIPSLEHPPYSILNEKQKMIVSKLSAILRIADALDYSRVQKIKNINLNLYEKKLTIVTEGTEDTTLEEWTFFKQSKFFENVFGIKCGLLKKGMV